MAIANMVCDIHSSTAAGLRLTLAHKLQKGAAGARSDDTKTLKGALLDWLVEPGGEPLQPPLSRNIKVNRGFNHDRTGFLLCPPDLDWSDDR